MSQRGGSVTSDVRFGDAVLSPMVPPGEADFLLVLEPTQVEPNRHSQTRRAVDHARRGGSRQAGEQEKLERGAARRVERAPAVAGRRTGWKLCAEAFPPEFFDAQPAGFPERLANGSEHEHRTSNGHRTSQRPVGSLAFDVGCSMLVCLMQTGDLPATNSPCYEQKSRIPPLHPSARRIFCRWPSCRTCNSPAQGHGAARLRSRPVFPQAHG